MRACVNVRTEPVEALPARRGRLAVEPPLVPILDRMGLSLHLMEACPGAETERRQVLDHPAECIQFVRVRHTVLDCRALGDTVLVHCVKRAAEQTRALREQLLPGEGK